MPITEQLCERIVATTFDSLTEDAIRAARQLLLDGVSVALAGSGAEEGPQIMAAHLRELGGIEAATAIGFGFRTQPVHAAYLNGTSMHVLDYEPMWSPATHAISTTLPTVLALAEWRGIGGAEAATALVKGVEIQGWLRYATDQDKPRKHKFHPPGLVGMFGAAVAAGHMLGLDAGRLRHAFGLAASRSNSLFANVGTMTKSSHCGLAGSLGLDAALLAARGFTANPDVLEAPLGWVETFVGEDFAYDELLKFGPPFRVVEPGYAIKMFPSQFGTHFVITAGLDLHQRIPDPCAIESVTLTAPVMAYTDRPDPKTGLDGKFSVQYTLACALLDGKIGIDTFTDARRFEPDIDAMIGRITLVADPSIPARFEDMHVEVAVQLTSGERLTARCDGPRGIYGTPPLTRDEHMTKVSDCLSRRLDDGRVEACVDLADRFERLEAGEIARLMALLGAARADSEAAGGAE